MSPWQIQTMPPNHIICGLNAYAQLKSLARFTSLLQISDRNSSPLLALIDTGADRSCLSHSHFLLEKKRNPTLFLFQPGVYLNNANGSPLQVEGAVRMTIPLTPNISITADFFVCQELSHDIILGLDILLSTRAIIDLHDQAITFRSPDPSVSPETKYFITTPLIPKHLTLSKDITINSREQRLIRVATVNTFVNSNSQVYMVENAHIFTPEYPIVVARGVIQSLSAQSGTSLQFDIMVINPTNRLVHLTRVSPLTHTLQPTPHPTSISSVDSAFSNCNPPPDLYLPTEATDIDPPFSTSFTPSLNPSLTASQRNQLLSLLRNNAHVFASTPDAPSVMRNIPPIHIHTGNSPPIRVPEYRRHPMAHRYIHDKVQEMLKHGLIEPSSSSWCFPVVLALKQNGKIRFCIDYRRLNAITKQDAYPLPRLDDILDSMHGKSYFTTLDAASGFHQLPLDNESKPKTAFSTHSGHYQWTRLPFGWINAPPNFQRTVDYILRGLTFLCALVYMDDIVIHSRTFEEHLEHLQLVFNRLHQYSCQLRLDKCHFAHHSIEYLGHIVGPQGIQPKPSLVQSILHFPSPQQSPSSSTAKAAVKSFVALANFYRRFVKGFASIVAPLLILTRKGQPFTWGPEQQHAFDTLKSAISTTPTLSYPRWDEPFILNTDASEVGVGAVLSQFDNNSVEKPLQFLSYAFNDREKEWSMPEKELYAFVYAVRKLRVYLYSQPFRWRTDAAALTFLRSAKRLSPKLLRWTLLLSEFRFSIEHIPTNKNVVADTLSRYPIHSLSSILTSSFTSTINPITAVSIFPSLPELLFSHNQFITEQHTDPYCRLWLSLLLPSHTFPPLNTIQTRAFHLCKKQYQNSHQRNLSRFILINSILCYILDAPSYRRSLPSDQPQFIRPVVPHSLRTKVLQYFHNRLHRKPTRTQRDISTHFYWPHLGNDVHLFVSSCHPCNSRNARSYLHGLLHSSPATSATHRMSIDLIGPRPLTVEGYRWIITMINHFTKWLVAVPLKDRTSIILMRTVEEHWLSEGYACAEVYADRAPELHTEEFKNLLTRYGSTLKPGPPHHSPTQGHVERVNRTIQDAIAKNLKGSEHQWSQFLKPVVYAYRLTVHSSTGYTPFFITHGWEPLPPLINSLLPPLPPSHTLHEYVTNLRNRIKQGWTSATNKLSQYHSNASSTLNQNRKPFNLPLGSLVYVRLPPAKGQSQGVQSFNSGLWKLVGYDEQSNKCTVVTKAGNTERKEDVHAQFVFPFTGTLNFTPALDYRTEEHNSNPSTPLLQAHPHQAQPRRRGRPRKPKSSTE